MVRSGHFIVDPEPYLEEITTHTHGQVRSGQVRSFYSGPRAIPGGNYNKHTWSGQVRSGQVSLFKMYVYHCCWRELQQTHMVRSGHFIVDPEPYLEEITTNTHGQVRSGQVSLFKMYVYRCCWRELQQTHMVRSGHFIVDPEPYLEEITTHTVRSGQVRSFYSGPRAIPGGNYNKHT